MHADEFRDYQSIRELRIAETLSDPEHVYNRLESLSDSGKDSYVKRLEAEREDLRRRVRAAQASLDDLKAENAVLVNERELAERRLSSVRESTCAKRQVSDKQSEIEFRQHGWQIEV